MNLRIETGHSVTADVAGVDARRVRFVTKDGRTMFEVSALEDGRSIEIRGVETCRVDEVLYGESLCVSPRYSNSVVISTKELP